MISLPWYRLAFKQQWFTHRQTRVPYLLYTCPLPLINLKVTLTCILIIIVFRILGIKAIGSDVDVNFPFVVSPPKTHWIRRCVMKIIPDFIIYYNNTVKSVYLSVRPFFRRSYVARPPNLVRGSGLRYFFLPIRPRHYCHRSMLSWYLSGMAWHFMDFDV